MDGIGNVYLYLAIGNTLSIYFFKIPYFPINSQYISWIPTISTLFYCVNIKLKMLEKYVKIKERGSMDAKFVELLEILEELEITKEQFAIVLELLKEFYDEDN